MAQLREWRSKETAYPDSWHGGIAAAVEARERGHRPRPALLARLNGRAVRPPTAKATSEEMVKPPTNTRRGDKYPFASITREGDPTTSDGARESEATRTP